MIVECVILLHGLARTSSSMEKLAARLEAENFITANVDYPARKFPVEELSVPAIERGLALCRTKAGANEISKIHFVTHSLGGIVVRHYLKNHTIKNLGRVVMMGPPNHGSEVVDRLKHFPGFYFLNGPAGMQLGTHETDIPKTLGKANFEAGIIAGNRSINLILSTMIPGENDGKVSVQSAHLEGEKDFVVLPVNHPLMMQDDAVIDQTVYFLKEGKFH